MSELDKKDIEKLAELSRLKISKDEEARLVVELKKIKVLLDEVATYDVSKLPSNTSQAHVFDVLRFEKAPPTHTTTVRRDKVQPSLAIEETEKIAPQFKLRHFVIPKIL